MDYKQIALAAASITLFAGFLFFKWKLATSIGAAAIIGGALLFAGTTPAKAE